MTTGPGSDPPLDGIAAAAAQDAGIDADLLVDFLAVLLAAVAAGNRLGRKDLATCRDAEQRLRHPRFAALYFLLAGMLTKFHHLGKGLAFILAFIGVKLFLQAGHKVISTSIPEIPSLVSLGVIILALTISIVASLRHPLPAGQDHDEDEHVLEPTPTGASDIR
jgi:hypothetical protein